MNDYPKRVKRQLRDLAGIAHEREVRRHLEELYEQFAGWKAGAVDTFDLTAKIHEFHNGPHRKLFAQYCASYVDLIVAAALVDGVLIESEVPAEAMDAIARIVEGIRSVRGRFGSEDPPEPEPDVKSRLRSEN
jgi:hypothetical protein